MERNTPVKDYYNHKYLIQPNNFGNRNSDKLNQLERDISLLHEDIKIIKSDISIIKEYIIAKKEREDNKWFY
tara:strand:+ start:82 stop:297 length:216 start_codon:yes stop_codon:yes gene_type:complete